MPGNDRILKAAADLLGQRTPPLDPQELASYAGSFLDRREEFLEAARNHGSPLYIIEEEVLLERAAAFLGAFRKALPSVRVFFALKSNNHPLVCGTLAAAGLGLDVSSGMELDLALGCDAREIIFTGPGKTDLELSRAIRCRDRVTIVMDSFGELERLERLAAQTGDAVRAGVRLSVDKSGLWRKFGIPLSDLERFIERADDCRHILLRGLQFHSSWNLTPDRQVDFIGKLGDALGRLPPERLGKLEFLDIGGGFWPPRGEWLSEGGTPAGRIHRAVTEGLPSGSGAFRLPAAPIEEFARHIGEALKKEIFPRAGLSIYTEPGRWICNDAAHILLTVVDKKANDLVITDGGTNAIGWERFETDFAPVINLSRPGLESHDCHVLGSLCTPHDLWGLSYFGRDIAPGDVLLIPAQGAYTYSLRQNFIKPLPGVVMFKSGPAGDRA